MVSMDQSLNELVRAASSSRAEALERAIDKESFKATIAALGGRKPAPPPPRPTTAAE